jgi:hypothetical protein
MKPGCGFLITAAGPAIPSSVIFHTPSKLPWADADWTTMRTARAAMQAIAFFVLRIEIASIWNVECFLNAYWKGLDQCRAT